MHVQLVNKNQLVKFDTLSPGDCYRLLNSTTVYMVIYPVIAPDKVRYNAVSINSGDTLNQPNVSVLPVDGFFVEQGAEYDPEFKNEIINVLEDYMQDITHMIFTKQNLRSALPDDFKTQKIQMAHELDEANVRLSRISSLIHWIKS